MVCNGSFAGNGSCIGPAITPKKPIPAYAEIAEDRRKHTEDMPGTQIGDPQKAAEAMISLATAKEAPLRLLLGSDALHFANYKIQMLQTEMEANKAITLSTDFQ